LRWIIACGLGLLLTCGTAHAVTPAQYCAALRASPPSAGRDAALAARCQSARPKPVLRTPPPPLVVRVPSPLRPVRPPPPVRVGPAHTEELVWQGALLTPNNIAGFRDYLDRYPSGTFAALARSNLQRLLPSDGGAADWAKGNNYLNGVGGLAQNYALALQWFRRAADEGSAKAMTDLGYMYEYGKGVAQDVAQAAQWYRWGADGGDAIGMKNLANMYEAGRGVAKDAAQAAYWREKAAAAK
jgi:Sel1 repeat